MNTERNVGLACGLVALVTIACVGLCGLGAAITAAGTAVGIGQAVEVIIPAEDAARGLRVRIPGGDIPLERVLEASVGDIPLEQVFEASVGDIPLDRTLDASVTVLAESLAEEFVRSSDVVAQALAEAGSSAEVREALGWPLEAGALLGEARFSDRFSNTLGTGKASLTLELKGSLATGTLELAAHRGPWMIGSEPASDGPSLSIPGTGLTLPLYLRPGDWVFDKLVVTLPSGEEIVLSAVR
jgi:hypothetical protein